MTPPAFISNHIEQPKGWVMFLPLKAVLWVCQVVLVNGSPPGSVSSRLEAALPFFYCICPTSPCGISLPPPGCCCLLRPSFWVGTAYKGLWSPSPQPEWLVTCCPRTRTGSEYPGRLLDWDPSGGAAQDDDTFPGTQALYVPRLTGQMEP